MFQMACYARSRLWRSTDEGKSFYCRYKKPNGFQFPNPTNSKPSETINLFNLPPYKTVGEAIAGLGEPVSKMETSEIPDNSHYDVIPRRDRERIHGVPEGKNLSSQTDLPKEQIGRLTKKDTTKFLRLDRGKPSNTLRGGEIFYHPTEDRYLTPREYMRIHGYPDSYVLRGPIRADNSEEPQPCFQDIVLASVCPPRSVLVSALSKKEMANRMIV